MHIDPYLIAMYYDGVLPEEHAFTTHLLTCKQCIEKLLHLERDLFLIEKFPLIDLPQKEIDKKTQNDKISATK